MAVVIKKRSTTKATCRNCRTELEYQYSDLQVLSNQGDPFGVLGIKCPVCSENVHHIKVALKHVTPTIKGE